MKKEISRNRLNKNQSNGCAVFGEKGKEVVLKIYGLPATDHIH